MIVIGKFRKNTANFLVQGIYKLIGNIKIIVKVKMSIKVLTV